MTLLNIANIPSRPWWKTTPQAVAATPDLSEDGCRLRDERRGVTFF